MGLSHLDHYNIEVADLDATIAFYCGVLGLTLGERPPLSVPGAWLYSENGRPTVHLIDRRGDGVARVKEPSGRLHHICFAATGKAEIRRRLQDAKLDFRTVVLPRVGITQFFVQDPNGINVEISFPPAETTAEDVAAAS